MHVVQQQSTSLDIWRECRGIENAYRYFGDILIGIIRQLPEPERSAILASESAAIPRPGDSWPNFCRPPLCDKARKQIVKDMREIALRATRLADLTETLIGHLPIEAEPVKYFATELPGTHWPASGRPVER